MQNLDSNSICSAVLYIIKNYPLTILLYCMVCFIAGLLISLVLILVMKKCKAFSRIPKYYNWLVKLYIPAIFTINSIVSLQLGLFWGSYETIKKTAFPSLHRFILQVSALFSKIRMQKLNLSEE
uniref:Uncharacterized protein n=1 Tax=Chryseobacterium endophyticum TaxID=1854762 RepID=A0AAU6WQS2_9FLAO